MPTSAVLSDLISDPLIKTALKLSNLKGNLKFIITDSR